MFINFKSVKLFIFFTILTMTEANGNIEEIMQEISKLGITKKHVIFNYCRVKIEYYQLLNSWRKELRERPSKNASEVEWQNKYKKLDEMEKACNQKLDLLNKTDKNYDGSILNPNDKKGIAIHSQVRKVIHMIDMISSKSDDIEKLKQIMALTIDK